MTSRSVEYATFTVERTLAATPERVFAAFADPEVKSKWFGDPNTPDDKHALDFRVGGREFSQGGPEGGPVFIYDALIRDIVAGERIVTTYEMTMDGERISVSVSTTEFSREGSGTKLVHTEQGVFLDGLDTAAAREHGTRELFDALATFIEEQP